jgi:hypothetical protein
MSYLLDRRYPRKTSLNLVVNHYKLDRPHRNYLIRYFSLEEIKDHKSRRIPPLRMRDKDIVIDAYNAIITLESMLSGRKFSGKWTDFSKDISAVFSSYKFTDDSRRSL